VHLSAGQRRPEQRSNDGQAILELSQMGQKSRPDLVFLVELWGFEPQTSCMPSSGNPSTLVHTCRSPSSHVHSSPPASAPVAVLSCCTAPYWPTEPVTPLQARDQPEPRTILPLAVPAPPGIRQRPPRASESHAFRAAARPLPHSRPSRDSAEQIQATRRRRSL
jgi:hypothetical protein